MAYTPPADSTPRIFFPIPGNDPANLEPGMIGLKTVSGGKEVWYKPPKDASGDPEPDAIRISTFEDATLLKLFGQTSTVALDTDDDVLSFTLGQTDYPEIGLDTKKSWSVNLTAITVGSSTVGVFKRWEGDISFIVGNEDGIVAFNQLIFGYLLPVSGESVDSNVLLAKPNIVITGAAAPYKIEIEVEHTNITTVKTVDIYWLMEIREVEGEAKGWS